ncbi:hypothetical protein BDV25DRAFT_159673, partial [Aspergillus avenaceus]
MRGSNDSSKVQCMPSFLFLLFSFPFLFCLPLFLYSGNTRRNFLTNLKDGTDHRLTTLPDLSMMMMSVYRTSV